MDVPASAAYDWRSRQKLKLTWCVGLDPTPCKTVVQIEMDYRPSDTCDSLYEEAELFEKVNGEKLPAEVLPYISIKEMNAPFIYGSDSKESLLSEVHKDLGGLSTAYAHDRIVCAEQSQPLEMTYHKRMRQGDADGDAVLLLRGGPFNPTAFYKVGTAEYVTRELPKDATTFDSMSLLPFAKLFGGFLGEFQSLAETGGVLVVSPDHSPEFVSFSDEDIESVTVAMLQEECERRFGIAKAQQMLLVGPNRLRIDGTGLRIDDSPIKDARRSDWLHTMGAIFCGNATNKAHVKAFGTPNILGAEQKFDLNVKTLTGKDIYFKEFNAFHTVGDLSAAIEKSSGISKKQFQLNYNGKCLDPTSTSTLWDVGIRCPGETVHLVLNLRGGMMQVTSGRLDYNKLHEVRRLVDFCDVDGAKLLLQSVNGALSVADAIARVEGADDADQDVDSLDEGELRALAKTLLRDKKRKLEKLATSEAGPSRA